MQYARGWLISLAVQATFRLSLPGCILGFTHPHQIVIREARAVGNSARQFAECDRVPPMDMLRQVKTECFKIFDVEFHGLTMAIGGKHDIFRLDVAVHDTVFVRRHQGLRALHRDPEKLLQARRLLEALAQVLSFDKLHDQKISPCFSIRHKSPRHGHR